VLYPNAVPTLAFKINTIIPTSVESSQVIEHMVIDDNFAQSSSNTNIQSFAIQSEAMLTTTKSIYT
ncbi:jg2669, partial [Pararge aegeria aegeria]